MKSYYLVMLILLFLFFIGCSSNKPDTSSTTSEPKVVSESAQPTGATPEPKTATETPQTINPPSQTASPPPKTTNSINSIIVFGKVTFESDVRPSKTQTVGDKENKREYYAYEDGYVEIKIDSMQFADKTEPIWIDKNNTMAVELPLENPLALPQKITIIINRKGYGSVEIKDIEITNNIVLLPDIQISKIKDKK